MSNETAPTPATKHTRQDYISSTEPKWCQGCGCYAVLKNLTSLFATLDLSPEKIAVISGIGCSSRTPYYVNSYGFHTLHGRAPTVAIGLKMAQPELSVWITTGDGDALAIGGNHFLHMMRRNPDIKMLLFNNQIYGLTKGQASPTTVPGTKAKGVPDGAFESPVHPVALAIAAGASFVARVPDIDSPMVNEVLLAAAAHKGTAFIEVLLNCPTFSEGAFTILTDRETKAGATVRMSAGKPLVFGAQSDQGIRINPQTFKPEVAKFEAGKPPADLLIHNPTTCEASLAYSLAMLDSPVLLGIFRQEQRTVYGESLPRADTITDVGDLLQGDGAWRETGSGPQPLG